MQNRRGEEPRTYFRTDRLYTIGNNWYVATREGNNIGPFTTRETAQKSISQYVSGVQARKNSRVQARSLSASQDPWANTNGL